MSEPQSRIALLSNTVSELTAVLDKYHADHHINPQSFDENNWAGHAYPLEIERARLELADASQELNDLVSGPLRMVQVQLRPKRVFYDLIHTHDIAKRVPKNGKISYAELAQSIGMAESALKRILRLAIAHRVFAETDDGFLCHSAASRLLAEDAAMNDWMEGLLDFVLPATIKQTEALAKWPNAEGPTEAAVTLVKNTPTFWAYLAQTPNAARRFAGAMTMLTRDEAYAWRHLVDNYPWGSLGNGTVVDLGGSVGDAAFAVTKQFPDLQFIVQDLPKTLASAQERPGVKVKFMEHSYFDEQPVKGADVYMFRQCFHSYMDHDAVRMLRALIPALKKGSRILIMDAVMAAPGVGPNVEERWNRGADVIMMSMFNAKEREAGEWKALFSSADPRFVWQGINQPEQSRMALIQAVWGPDR